MEDKYQWLESVEGEEALNWVKERNRRTLDEFEKDSFYNDAYTTALNFFQAQDKIPIPVIENNSVYNFWMDEKHIKGILRRTTLDSYNSDNPKWEAVLDIDELAKKENKSWVYKDISFLPKSARALVYLSDGGKDANYIREFDLEAKSFVENGFELSESKGSAIWKDQDTLLIFRDFGPDTLTECGYPRIIKEWKRGTSIEDCKEIISIPSDQTFIWPMIEHLDGSHVEVFAAALDFFRSKLFLRNGDELIDIDLPEHIRCHEIHKEQLLFELQESWRDFKSGSVLSLDLKKVRQKEPVEPEVVIEPTSRSSFDFLNSTKETLVVVMQEDVKARVYEMKQGKDGWEKEKVNIPDFGSVYFVEGCSDHETYFVSYENFISPRKMFLKTVGEDSLKVVKSEVQKFESENLTVDQNFAVSADGTKIPYFIVHMKDIELNGKNPTILWGYGGFQIPVAPVFSNHRGKLWFEKGGVYVVANIRGGGEYGPTWHQAALKQNRHKAYEDFFAVAEDLINRKITSPEHLGCHGGSNGGLLMGVCLTQRPDLFKAIHCSVPLLDMLRFHKLLAGASWVAEYGSPENDEERKYLESYSPYHNLKEDKAYPKILFSTSTKDDRVHPGHARKMAALMEDLNYPFYYYENTEGGHAGSADYTQYARGTALSFAYFWKLLS